jgi:DNA topoisomerase I, bacterial
MDLDRTKKTLVIVESPTKATTIRKYLPKNFTVVASKGHVRDLPSDRMGIDVEHNFAPEYVITENKGALIADLKKKLASSEQLLLATDEDREGESISWHLVQVLRPTVPYKRMVFHEITKKAINASLDQGRDLDEKLIDAQEDRRIIDRLYGYEVSPVLWKRLSNKKLSAGRVQSVGLRFIVEKEMTRMNFSSSSYYDIEATLSDANGERLVARLESVDGRRIAGSKDFNSETGAFSGKALLLDGEKAEKLIEEAKNGDFTVDSVMQKPSTAYPYPPFTTSTLQQAANARLHLSAKETMRVAQSLFEHGFITYMRTDSTFLSAECLDASREAIVSSFGKDYLNPTVRQFVTKSKNAQEAHEAIRPSGDVVRKPEETGLAGRELALYTLIYQRTLATQMAPARKSTTTVKLSNGNAVYTASGTSIVFPGFLKVYGLDASDEESEEKTQLPPVTAGDRLKTEALELKDHTTNPPNRYTEASLVKKLEEQGIGRPSTYASIISTLLERGYVAEDKTTLIPTFLGFATHNFLSVAFAPLVDYNYTSEMETRLDEIAEGSMDRLKYLNEFYFGENGLESLVKSAKAGKEDVKTLSIPTLSGCCDVNDEKVTYSVKVGPFGAYVATSLKGENGKQLLVNIPQTMLPGMVGDKDIAALIASSLTPREKEVAPGTIILREGRWGRYWEKDGKTVNVPKGKIPAESYTDEQIEYLFTLPREVAVTKEGKSVTLNLGPYGPYLSSDGKNYRLFGSVFDCDEKKALQVVEASSSKSQEPLKVFEPFMDKELRLLAGKFGIYLKWGDINCPIGKDRDPMTLTQSDAEAIAKANEGKTPRRRGRSK